jgi:hypothetical protein
MFNDLENILNLILQKLEINEELLQVSLSALTTKRDVASFLGKTTKTIDNYVENGTFIEDVHYFYNEKNKVEFIPLGIVSYKKKPEKSVTTKKSLVMPISNIDSIVKGL